MRAGPGLGSRRRRRKFYPRQGKSSCLLGKLLCHVGWYNLPHRRASFFIDPKNCFLTDGLNRQTIPGGIQRGGWDRISKRMEKKMLLTISIMSSFSVRPSVRKKFREKTSQMISLNLMADEWLRVVLSHHRTGEMMKVRGTMNKYNDRRADQKGTRLGA